MKNNIDAQEAVSVYLEAQNEFGTTELVSKSNYVIPDSYEDIQHEDQTEWYPAYGFCPQCGVAGNSRTRCAYNCDDTCSAGHSYKSAQSISQAAEYQGRTVTLNKPFRTSDGPKKFAVYTRNESGNVVIVRFGDPNMSIKKSDPERRKSFRARHNCDNPGPKWKARYWSCRMW